MADLKKLSKLRRKRRNARLISYKLEEGGHKLAQESDDDRFYQPTEEDLVYSSDDPDNVRHRIIDYDDFYDDDVIDLTPTHSPIDSDESPLLPKFSAQTENDIESADSSSPDKFLKQYELYGNELYEKHTESYKHIPIRKPKESSRFNPKHNSRPYQYNAMPNNSDSEGESHNQSKWVKIKTKNKPRKISKLIKPHYEDDSQATKNGLQENKLLSDDHDKTNHPMGQDRFKHSITIIEHSTDASETLPKECVDKIVNFISKEVGSYGFTINSLVSNWFKPNSTKSTKLNNHFVYFSKDQ